MGAGLQGGGGGCRFKGSISGWRGGCLQEVRRLRVVGVHRSALRREKLVHNLFAERERVLQRERGFFIDNLLVRVHFIIEMI